MPDPSRLPALGRRGGGWVALQFVLLGVLIVAGVRGRGDVQGNTLLLVVALGSILIVIGTVVIGLGIRTLDRSLSAMPKPVAEGELIDRGIYARVRHPIYLGILIVAFGWSVAMASLAALIVAFVFVGFFDLKARREEAWLAESYPTYPEYARHTSRFIPGVY